MKIKSFCFLIFSLFISSFPAWGQQEYPTKPINFILVYAPGGASDTSSKAIIEALKKVLKVPIIPKYITGAGGSIGAHELSKARPDGYTIGNVTGVAMAFAPHINPVKYNPLKDFDYIGTYAQATVGLIVSAQSPIKSLKDLIETARKNPGQVKFANTSPGGWQGLATTYLEKVEKIRIKGVPFIGGHAEGMSALLGGHVDYMSANPAGIKPYLKSGHIRMIASCSYERHSDLSVPTLREMGYDFDAVSWIAAGAPKGLPIQIKKKLEDALAKAVNDADYVKIMKNLDTPVDYHNGEDYQKIIQKYYSIWGELLKDGYRY